MLSVGLVGCINANLANTVCDQIDLFSGCAREVDNASIDKGTSIIDRDRDLASTFSNDPNLRAETECTMRRGEF